jgi:hypothetical protein
MRNLKKIIASLSLLVVLSMVWGSAVAEDGLLFRRNVSMTPDLETAVVGLYMMDFYVPAQKSTGELYATDTVEGGIEYMLADGVTNAYEDRYYAKPLISAYIDGRSDFSMGDDEDSAVYAIDGGIILGAMDAYVAVSLDDGTTWRRTNLSNTASISSFNLANGQAAPGHVHNVVHQVFGDNVLIAWASKYCEEGTPLFSLLELSTTDPFLISYLADLETTYGKDAVYLYDLFGVAGPQESVNYAELGFPEVGEIPYSCVWTARGKLMVGDDLATTSVVEATHVRWTRPERLTSGTRDANLPAVDCAAGAGCVLTWQEDPEGLRPGTAQGPGEGWSGAIANSQTDIWYSHISQADFDKVFQYTTDGSLVLGAVTMEQYESYAVLDMPRPYVPMAMPVRLTDNGKCRPLSTETKPTPPYCFIDFDTIEDVNVYNIATLTALVAPEAGADFCASSIWWETPGGIQQEVCVTEEGRVMVGRVAATRVRMNLKPYTRGDGSKSAWLVMAAEETKALGDMLVDPYGNPTEDPLDIGKEMWYHSFDPFKTGQDEYMVAQGGLLNQPSKCSPWTVYADETVATCVPYEFFPIQTDPLNGAPFYLTEIARRFSLATNSVTAAVSSESGLSAMLIYKQSIINSGGPADVVIRRMFIPEDFNPAVDNPYAYENMDCSQWADLTWVDNLGVVHEINPNYLQGVCLSEATNVSANTIVACEGISSGNILYGNDVCADTFPVADDGSIPEDPTLFPRVVEWRNCSDAAESFSGCEADNDLDDQIWENPYDISKGHRGFIDGDLMVVTYAWSPNWKANSVGNDHYNFYVRRSFDGGETWTTTPPELGGVGTSHIENYCVLDPTECVGTLFTYGPGEFEQARNASQLIGNKTTILDPRYGPTGTLKEYPTIRTDWLISHFGTPTQALPYADDLARDRSKYFLIYETGDNETVTVGEAVPLDLFYSRATVWGDIYELMEYTNGTTVFFAWPWVEMEQGALSGEASMLVNPGGTFMYAVWAQWEEDTWVDEYGIEHEEVFNSDMPFRRFMYLPDDSPISSVPVASILVAPSTAFLGDTLTFIGSGYDADDPDGYNNITAYLWYSTLNGLLSNEAVFSTNTLNAGLHTISLVVVDDEGESSAPAHAVLFVADDIYRTNLPMLRK